MRSASETPRAHRLEDHPDPQQVGRVADQHPGDRQHPPLGEHEHGEEGRRDAEREAEEEAEVDDEAQLPVADLEEDPVGQLRLGLDPVDHHQLQVDELVEVGADLIGDRADDLRQLLLDPGVHGRPQARRQVVPELRPLALHDPLDQLVDVAAGGGQHVLGDRLRVELAVEVGGAAELGDPLVDRDRAHLRRARGDDPLPADPTLADAGDLADATRQEVGEGGEPRQPEAGEAHRVEEHPDAGPVGDVADRAGEQRDRDQAERLAAHGAGRERSR